MSPMRPSSPQAAPSPQVINPDGAWCWFQDERALVDPEAGLLVVGSIASGEPLRMLRVAGTSISRSWISRRAPPRW